MKNVFYYDTQIGTIGISDNGKAITGVFFPGKPVDKISDAFLNETPLIKETACQLREYFDGKRKVFDISLEIGGTPFQRAVWKALTEIPYGETRTYKEIAEKIGNPKACRAVGMANNRNPVAIIIPCHRVIGADGSLVGYASGLEIKRKLLELERRVLSGL